MRSCEVLFVLLNCLAAICFKPTERGGLIEEGGKRREGVELPDLYIYFGKA